MQNPPTGGAAARALLLAVPLCLATGCSYIERARDGSDLAVGVAEHFKLEALVQAEIERQRLRAARCLSPLLTPATISAAAVDSRLGTFWVDGLLADCPQFAAFVSELMLRRAQAAGLGVVALRPEPKGMATPVAAEEKGGAVEVVGP